MSLQEFFFKNALNEAEIKIDKIFIDHKNATCSNGNITYPVVFSHEMINKVSAINKTLDKTVDYFYMGTHTKQKEWINEFRNKNSILTISRRGRNPELKYILDIDYYTNMSKAKFTLCPIDIYPWSYRFFEAIMCNTIPILKDSTDKYCHNFKYYTKDEEHIYNIDWIEYNRKQLLLFHTIKKNWYELPQWMSSLKKIYTTSPLISKNSPYYTTNVNHVYTNTRVCSLSSDPLKWNSILAVHDKMIIPDSNHFCINLDKWQNDVHQIHDRLAYNYHYIKNKNESDVINITSEALLVGNSFSSKNSGHDLSIILDVLNYLIEHAEIKLLVLLDISKLYPNNLDIIKLFIRDLAVEIFFMEASYVYNFGTIHILPKEYINITKHANIISTIRNRLLEPHDHLPKRILLLKCHRNNQVTRRDTSLTCEKLINKLENDHGFTFINPETTNIFDLSNILMHATHIICSWGGILYTNMIFFNLNANIILFPIRNQQPNKHWEYITSHANKIINIKNTDLDNENNIEEYNNILNNILETT